MDAYILKNIFGTGSICVQSLAKDRKYFKGFYFSSCMRTFVFTGVTKR